MFGNSNNCRSLLRYEAVRTGYDDRSTARSSDKNVYLNMRPRLVEQLGMIERLKYSKDLVTLI